MDQQPSSFRRRLASPLQSAVHIADRPLWNLARRRYQPFQGTELLISRTRAHQRGVIDTGDGRLDDAFAAWFDRWGEGQEYFFRTEGPGLIDPRYGFFFLSPTRVVFHALNPKDAEWHRARSSPIAAGLARRAAKTLHVDAAVSLRDFHDQNFWHIFSDVFSKLLLAEEAYVPREVPAVVGHRLAAMPCWPDVKQVFERFRPILVQEPDTFVRAERLYVGAPLTNAPWVFDAFLDLLERQDQPTVDGCAREPERAIFVTRASNRIRAVVNLDEVHEICTRQGFDIVDFDRLSFADARAVAARARVIAGLHGAGLTNMMFRRGRPTTIGEIAMEHPMSPEYFILSRQFGFTYRAMLGTFAGDSSEQRFVVDPVRFDEFLASLLDSSPRRIDGASSSHREV